MTILYASGEDEGFSVIAGSMQTADTTKYRPTYSRASFCPTGGGGLAASFDVQLAFSGALLSYLTAQPAGDKDFWFSYRWVGGGGFLSGLIGLRVYDSSGKEFIRLISNGGGDVMLQTSSDGFASNTVSYTASTIAQPGTPTEYGFRIKRHASLGVLQWWINGGLWFQTTVGDTTGIITGQPDKIRWTIPNSNGDMYLSEVICTSADDPSIGLSLATLVPTADGFSVGWSGGYASISEVPIDTSTLLTTGAAGLDSTFVASNLPTLTGSQVVRGIVLSGKWRESVGSPQNVKGLLRISGTTYASAQQAAPAVSGTLQFIWETSPATSVAFGETEVNNAEIGMRSVA